MISEEWEKTCRNMEEAPNSNWGIRKYCIGEVLFKVSFKTLNG